MTILTYMLDALTGHTRVTLTETQRMLVLVDGRINAILGPGRHRIKVARSLQELHDLSSFRFTSDYASALRRERPDLVEAHLTEVVTGANELALVSRDGRLYEVVTPDTRVLYWTDAATWSVERLTLSADHRVTPALAQRLMRSGLTRQLVSHEVPAGKVGLLSVDGAFREVLEPGTHWHWMLGLKHGVRLIDTRWMSHEVTGQEILTRDRVTIRVNLTAVYRVADPVRAHQAVDDFAQALHRALQLAFRKTLGVLTLDQLLADKVSVDADAAEAVRAEMAEIGLEVGEIALKDVILPGEMREILNQVVAAQKEAEANVIRRREETNATRSLLNTAKVMAENPVMLRLKELEALESIAEKVDRLTVHNGTQGLMSDIVRLQD
ncbi:MAG: slipin family protein [Pseudomonadota bacterium]